MRKPILGCALIFGGLLFCLAGVCLLGRPEMYRAAARVKLDWDSLVTHYSTAIQSELEVIQSEAVLVRVIDVLDLKQRWGNSVPLTTGESVARLRRCLELRVGHNTTLIEIRAAAEDPKEAARYANAVADAYVQWRLESGRKLLQGSLQSLEQRAQEHGERIKTASENLEKLRRELWLSETQPAEVDEQHPEYARAKQQLADMKDFLKLLERKIKLERDELLVPKSGQVEIIERAIPPTRPANPSRAISVGVALASLPAGVAVIGFGGLLLRRSLSISS